MFLCIVVMLNLLIAQLSDTYQNIQSDAHRGLELNRAWIVTRMEINSVFMGVSSQKFARERKKAASAVFATQLRKYSHTHNRSNKRSSNLQPGNKDDEN